MFDARCNLPILFTREELSPLSYLFKGDNYAFGCNSCQSWTAARHKSLVGPKFGTVGDSTQHHRCLSHDRMHL